jgi:hypothetical protein
MNEADSAQRVHRTLEIHFEEFVKLSWLGCQAREVSEYYVIDVALSSRLCRLLHMPSGRGFVCHWLHEQAVG